MSDPRFDEGHGEARLKIGEPFLRPRLVALEILVARQDFAVGVKDECG